MKKIILKLKILIFLIITFIAIQAIAKTKHPDCQGPNRYPASVAYVYLKNLKLITPSEYAKSKIMVKRLASEKMSKNLFTQIHHITFILESGKIFEVITDNEVSFDECSMSGVEVYLIKNYEIY